MSKREKTRLLPGPPSPSLQAIGSRVLATHEKSEMLFVHLASRC